MRAVRGLHLNPHKFVSADASRLAACSPLHARVLALHGTGKAVLEVTAVLLSGVTIDDRLVLQIAGLVDPDLRSKLVTACRLRRGMVALTVPEREAILAALNDAPATLHGVRDALVTDPAWQTRQRLG
jgi:hypothetical protein